MNKSRIIENVGKHVRLRAIAMHLNDDDVVVSEKDDDWEIREASPKGGLLLKNMRTESELRLGLDAIFSWTDDAPRGPEFGILRLTVQVFVRTQGATYEPVTRPGDRLAPRPYSLEEEVLLEATLLFHEWKNFLIVTAHNALTELNLVQDLPGGANEFSDVWELMMARWVPEYTENNYRHFRPLFAQGIQRQLNGVDRLLTVFGHVLPSDYQAELVRASRRLKVEAEAYSLVKLFGKGIGGRPTAESEKQEAHAFQLRFAEVIRTLRHLDHEANRRRELLKRPKS